MPLLNAKQHYLGSDSGTDPYSAEAHHLSNALYITTRAGDRPYISDINIDLHDFCITLTISHEACSDQSRLLPATPIQLELIMVLLYN